MSAPARSRTAAAVTALLLLTMFLPAAAAFDVTFSKSSYVVGEEILVAAEKPANATVEIEIKESGTHLYRPWI